MKFLNYAGALALCFYAAVSADAQTVKQVDCSKGKSITAAIDNLKNDQAYVIQVTGTCNENVAVRDFEGISLEIVGTPSATINGVATVPPDAAVQVVNSRSVRLANMTINGALTPAPGPTTGNTGAIIMRSCRNCSIQDVTVNHDRSGVLWLTSQGTQGNVTANISQGTGSAVANGSDVTFLNYEAIGNVSPRSFAGIVVDANSRLRQVYTVPRQIKNFINGIMVRNAATIEGGGACGSPLSACLEIRDNNYGMRVTAGQATAMAGVHFINNGAGIWLENSATAMMGPLVDITGSNAVGGSAGNGLTVTHNSHASFLSNQPPGLPNNITGNLRRGISIATGSSVMLSGLAGSGANNVTGNSSPDIGCDATSSLTGTGTLPGASAVVCVNSNAAPIPLP